MSEATTQAPPAAAWVGWVREGVPRARWRAVCGAATDDECMALLIRWRTPWQTTERKVMRAGEKP